MANPLFGVAQALANRFFPDRNKPSGLSFRFPFNTQSVTNFSHQLQLQPAKLEWITGAFIDNSLNAQQFQLVIGETGQKVTVPAFSQASIELLGLITDKVSLQGITTGNVDVVCIFTNYVPQAANSIWSVIDPGTIIGQITVNGSVTALPTDANSVDRSGTIVGGANTPQALCAANPTRRLLNIFNPFANGNLGNGGILTVSFDTGKIYGAPGGFDLAPGGSFRFDGFGIPNEAVFISSTDAAAVFSAIEI